MACRGCQKKSKKFQEEIKKMAKETKETKETEEKVNYSPKTLQEKQIEHFKRVCLHGVPNGYTCRTCNKVIEIPKDAALKPRDYVEEK